MKKLLAVLLAVSMIFSLCACGNQNDNPGTGEGEPEKEATWKEKMGDVEKKTGNRVVIFRNLVRFDDSLKEFAAFGSVPEETDGAYPIAILAKVWTKGVNGDMKAVDGSGKEYTVKAADLEKATIKVTEDGVGILVAGKTEVKDIKYLITPDKEALLYVEPEEIVTMPEIFTALGYDGCTNVFVTAADGFWVCTDNAGETEGSEIRGLLSGAVNCNLTVEGKGGAGKINDVFYFDIVE